MISTCCKNSHLHHLIIMWHIRFFQTFVNNVKILLTCVVRQTIMYYFLKKIYRKFLVNNNITIFILEYYTCGNKIIRTFQNNNKEINIENQISSKACSSRCCCTADDATKSRSFRRRLRRCCQADKFPSSDNTNGATKHHFHFNKLNKLTNSSQIYQFQA